MKCLECGDRQVKFVIRHATIKHELGEVKTSGSGKCWACLNKFIQSQLPPLVED